MLDIKNRVNEISTCTSTSIPEEVLNSTQPLILRGFASQWPIVIAGRKSNEAAADYLRSIYSQEPILACHGAPENNGRVFYNEQMNDFNYTGANVNLNLVLDSLLKHQTDTTPPTMYMGSTELNRWFPNFTKENICHIPNQKPLASIWIGNQSRIAAHYDFPQNIACNVVGQRRFTLFPPDQISNLYVGPIEFAPGGQEISLVDFDNPDFDKFPKFKDAMDNAIVADLEPGDALLLPSMWWHHVQGKSPFNVLVTHWWRNSPAHLGRPNNALLAAILSLRSLPTEQRLAWKNIFDHYIFDKELTSQEHIPEQAQDILKLPLDELTARKLRANLLNKLKR
jgi:hypothetical protein